MAANTKIMFRNIFEVTKYENKPYNTNQQYQPAKEHPNPIHRHHNSTNGSNNTTNVGAIISFLWCQALSLFSILLLYHYLFIYQAYYKNLENSILKRKKWIV